MHHYYYEEYDEGIWKQGELMPSIVYPNPSKGTITIDFETLFYGKHIIKVFGYNGAKVQDNEYNLVKGKQKIQINTYNLAAGTYIYKIESSYGYAEGKFVIQ